MAFLILRYTFATLLAMLFVAQRAENMWLFSLSDIIGNPKY
jgi:hypothetical protein